MASKIVSIIVEDVERDEILSWLVGSFYSFFPEPIHPIYTTANHAYLCEYSIGGFAIIVKAFPAPSKWTGIFPKSYKVSPISASQLIEVAMIEVDKTPEDVVVHFWIRESIAFDWLRAMAMAVRVNWYSNSRIELGENLIQKPGVDNQLDLSQTDDNLSIKEMAKKYRVHKSSIELWLKIVPLWNDGKTEDEIAEILDLKDARNVRYHKSKMRKKGFYLL